jgi:hypothetical protein
MQQTQQQPSSEHPRTHRAWKTFPLPARRLIDEMVAERSTPTCPLCGDWLGARPHSRVRTVISAAARCCDLECRACRRFHPVLPEETRHLYRVHRLASAVMRA